MQHCDSQQSSKAVRAPVVRSASTNIQTRHIVGCGRDPARACWRLARGSPATSRGARPTRPRSPPAPPAARPTRRCPVHAPVGDEVQRGQTLGDAGGMVVAGRHQDDAVPEADPPGALRRGGQEDLGRRGVGVFLQEVMLHLPGVVDSQPIGQLDLGQRVLEELLLANPRPTAGAAGARRRPRIACPLLSRPRHGRGRPIVAQEAGGRRGPAAATAIPRKGCVGSGTSDAAGPGGDDVQLRIWCRGSSSW